MGFGICERSLVLVLFCLCSCFTVWFCSPESCMKFFFFLASCFAKIFGGELWEFGTCARSMYFGSVLLMFLLYYVVLFSRKLSGTVRERTFVFWYFVLGRCFLVLFCQCICFIVWFCSPVICLKETSCQVFFCLLPRSAPLLCFSSFSSFFSFSSSPLFAPLFWSVCLSVFPLGLGLPEEPLKGSISGQSVSQLLGSGDLLMLPLC